MAYSTRIIETFGGTRALARILKLPPSTVQSWKDSGIIPAKHQQAVVDAAKAEGKSITPADFFEPAESPQSEAAA